MCLSFERAYRKSAGHIKPWSRSSAPSVRRTNDAGPGADEQNCNPGSMTNAAARRRSEPAGASGETEIASHRRSQIDSVRLTRIFPCPPPRFAREREQIRRFDVSRLAARLRPRSHGRKPGVTGLRTHGEVGDSRLLGDAGDQGEGEGKQPKIASSVAKSARRRGAVRPPARAGRRRPASDFDAQRHARLPVLR